jgi:Protein of unknown function (DUF1638)
MSSSPTGPTSTTGSSTNSPSHVELAGPSIPQDLGAGELLFIETRATRLTTPRADSTVAVIACGAIAQPCNRLVQRLGLPVDVYPLPPLLHNQPQRIAGEVEKLADLLAPRYDRVAVGYADCGTYGALDEVCDQLGLRRLGGLHCYDVYAGPDRVEALFEEQPGTYLLTDFLVRSFARTVITELGLDRYPDLRDAYFAHYTRVVWLTQDPDGELETLALDAAAAIGLPLTRLDVGTSGLERELLLLVG